MNSTIADLQHLARLGVKFSIETDDDGNFLTYLSGQSSTLIAPTPFTLGMRTFTDLTDAIAWLYTRSKDEWPELFWKR